MNHWTALGAMLVGVGALGLSIYSDSERRKAIAVSPAYIDEKMAAMESRVQAAEAKAIAAEEAVERELQATQTTPASDDLLKLLEDRVAKEEKYIEDRAKIEERLIKLDQLRRRAQEETEARKRELRSEPDAPYALQDFAPVSPLKDKDKGKK